MYTMRFDMRCPSGGAPAPQLYDAALQMCGWAETRGAVLAVLSEHHAASDGHLPSPLILAAAISARTSVLNVLVAAAVLPLYDPVRLAEDISVLDNLSRGRVSYAFGIGHRREEYDHLDVERAWREIGTYLLRDATMAAAYRHGDESVASITAARTVSELRLADGPYEVVTVDEAAARIRASGVLPLHPLCGGLPAELAWPYLERAATAAEMSGGQ